MFDWEPLASPEKLVTCMPMLHCICSFVTTNCLLLRVNKKRRIFRCHLCQSSIITTLKQKLLDRFFVTCFCFIFKSRFVLFLNLSSASSRKYLYMYAVTLLFIYIHFIYICYYYIILLYIHNNNIT